jgi:hypothetical protein
MAATTFVVVALIVAVDAGVPLHGCMGLILRGEVGVIVESTSTGGWFARLAMNMRLAL